MRQPAPRRPCPSRRRRGRAAPVVGVGLATVALALAGCANVGDEGATDTAVAGTVDGEPITVAAVDERIEQELFEEEFGGHPDRLYTARREALLDVIDERLLAAAAREAGTPPDEWLAAEIADLPPITEEDLMQLFEAVRDRLPADATLDPYREQLRTHLEEQRVDRVLADLREQAEVDLSLPRERFQVEAIGPSLGPADAPVTIVEFSDFQCPFCARVLPTLRALHERYPQAVRIVYRHLPLPFHEQARLAAVASVCAHRQDRFWDYHDTLFARQEALAREDLIGHAEALGLDVAAFETCLDAADAAAVVQADIEAARAAGATGTPTFFVNGIKMTGARPVEQFETVIEEERERIAP